MPASRFLRSGPSFVCTRVMWFLKRYRFVNVINVIKVVVVDVVVVDVVVDIVVVDVVVVCCCDGRSVLSFECKCVMWFLKRYRFVLVINDADVVVVVVVVVDYVALVVVIDDALLLL